MIELNPGEATHFLEETAVAEFEARLELAFGPGATGGVFGYRWGVFGNEPFNQEFRPTLTQFPSAAAVKENLFLYNMWVLDSGDTDGDSWKYVYHHSVKSGTLIQEA